MSWIYTIVFAGLMFSSPAEDLKSLELKLKTEPVEVVTVMSDESEKFDQTYPLNANGRVSISNVNGSIIVEAWDRSEVRLEYTKVADTKERLADVEVRVDARADHFSVETDYGNWNNRNGGREWINRNHGKLTVDYHLRVPRGAVLNEVETVNGSVSVSNFVNITKVSAVNGSVSATNIRGTASLSTVNGEVTADFDELRTGSKINLDTVNGRVNLLIPSDANATVKADSLNGNITNAFGLPVHKGKYVGRDLYGRIGTGDVQIKLSSVNGALSIGRKDDGKSASPATNLLPQKDKDDEDWDDVDVDIDASIDTERMNRDIAKAVKGAEKDVAKATKDAHREINRLGPEIAKMTAESISRGAEAMEQTEKMLKSEKFKQKLRNAQAKQNDLASKMEFLNFTAAFPRVEKRSNSFAVKGVPKVTVMTKGCSVRVLGWDKSEVQYKVTQFSDARNNAPLKVKELHSDTSVDITVENPYEDALKGNFAGDRNRVRVDVFVPRKSNLKINANGEIRLEGVSGEVELAGSDEAINVRDLDGKLRVTNADGRVRIIGFRGELEAATADGTMNLEGDFQKLTARANNGSIILTLPEGISADLIANCTDIEGDGIAMIRNGGDESRPRYKLGKGGPLFDLLTNGEIQVRSTNSIKESF